MPIVIGEGIRTGSGQPQRAYRHRGELGTSQITISTELAGRASLGDAGLSQLVDGGLEEAAAVVVEVIAGRRWKPHDSGEQCSYLPTSHLPLRARGPISASIEDTHGMELGEGADVETVVVIYEWIETTHLPVG